MQASLIPMKGREDSTKRKMKPEERNRQDKKKKPDRKSFTDKREFNF